MPQFVLQHLTGPRKGVCHELNTDAVLGRDENADILVADTTVSRRHAELKIKKDAIWLNDLGSQNGVFVNGARVESRRKLGAGDVLTLGKICFILLEDDSEGAATILSEPTRRFEVGAESTEFRLIGEAPAFHDCLRIAHRFAQAQLPILIEGETGTGKELVARWIHQLSKGRGSFVPVNCAAIPEQLFEAELFGVEKGAFTGATESRAGRFESAHGGTIFLDEIGELPLSLQPKLLRVLEERRVTPIGGNDEKPVRCRVLAATNRDLDSEQASGAFRTDLYHRISVLTLHVPSLRDRVDDIQLLSTHFAERAAAKLGCEPHRFTAGAFDALRTYPWPGNIRELRNVIERAVVLTDGPEVDVADLLLTSTATRKSGALTTLADVEREAIVKALRFHDGNITHAAKSLGISRPTLRRKMKHYGLTK